MRRPMIQAKQASPTSGISMNSTLAGIPASVAVAGEKGSWTIAFSTKCGAYLPPNASSGMSTATLLPERWRPSFPGPPAA